MDPMSPKVVLCGYQRRGSWPVFLKKAQVRRRTAGCQEQWTPEAAKRVGRSSVVMARAESWVMQYVERGGVGIEAGNVPWLQG
ncbi:hypothetical protein E2C01_070490 [Portunus trituberculatus]|uniref:Uncharacterized protein n=1 Tax=Portunus trituberculatus TaxID=210409 RepID=A0A5B7I286_PORTR|nr:hypothetical protein [Portunus trituberculatus]